MREPDPRLVPVIEGIFEWPQKLLFWPDALGAEYRVSFGLTEARLSLPVLSSKNDDFQLQAPAVLKREARIDWGTVLVRPSGISIVKAVALIVLGLPSDLEDGSVHYAGVEFPHGFGDWLRLVRKWVAAIIGEDLVIESGDIPGTVPEGLRLYALSERYPSPMPHSAPGLWTIAEPSGQSWNINSGKTISRAAWERAVRLANESAQVPVEHEFLSSARAFLGQRATRMAVIEAGSAVEISLGMAIRNRLLQRNEADAVHELLDRKTLGALPRVARRFGVQCPTSLEPLLKLRNDAVHSGISPPYPDAKAAIELAARVLEMHSPLPP